MNASGPSPNPWPAGLIAYFVVFIGCIVVFIVLAARQKVDLARPDYYEDAGRYQEQIERLNHSGAFRSQVGIRYGAADQCISLQLPAAHVGRAVTGEVHLYRPADAGSDQSFPLSPDTNGVQRIDARNLRAGLWKVRVLWKVEGQEYFHDQSVIVGSPAGARAGPTSDGRGLHEARTSSRSACEWSLPRSEGNSKLLPTLTLFLSSTGGGTCLAG
jgi:hypothetical protein